MLGTVVNYGGQHPDEFGGYGLAWLGADDASVFAMFTDHVPDHRAALAAMVPFPDELIVCQSALSEAESRGLQSLLLEELNGRYLSLGAGNGSVAVQLKASEEDVAADLEQRFGDAVTLRVGNFPYPIAADQRSIAACQRDVTGPTQTDAGIRASLTFSTPSVPSGVDADATVTVTNDGAETFTLISGSPLVGVVVEPATTRALAVFDGSIAGVGVGATLQPGESYDIPVLVGAASCDPTIGYTVPPGAYEVVVPVIVTHGQTGAESVNSLVARATFEVT